MPTPQEGPSITEKQVLSAIRAYLLANLPPGTPVIRGQVNRVPEPGVENFVIMWPLARTRLGTTLETWADDTWQTTFTAPTQLDVQLDFHGDGGANGSTVLQILWKSPASCAFLTPFGVTPLYCDDSRQIPFINDQNQYEDRWTMTITMQINPEVSTAQQSAIELDVGLVEVDVTPPAEHRTL